MFYFLPVISCKITFFLSFDTNVLLPYAMQIRYYNSSKTTDNHHKCTYILLKLAHQQTSHSDEGKKIVLEKG